MLQRTLTILGSTGSIGTNTLDVLARQFLWAVRPQQRSQRIARKYPPRADGEAG